MILVTQSLLLLRCMRSTVKQKHTGGAEQRKYEFCVARNLSSPTTAPVVTRTVESRSQRHKDQQQLRSLTQFPTIPIYSTNHFCLKGTCSSSSWSNQNYSINQNSSLATKCQSVTKRQNFPTTTTAPLSAFNFGKVISFFVTQMTPFPFPVSTFRLPILNFFQPISEV